MNKLTQQDREEFERIPAVVSLLVRAADVPREHRHELFRVARIFHDVGHHGSCQPNLCHKAQKFSAFLEEKEKKAKAEAEAYELELEEVSI